MNLQKMIGMQRELDNRIIKDHKLEGNDLIANTYVALQVELAEFANEGRWFKHWKVDKKPNTKATRGINDPFGTPVIEEYNPLLEEFVDSVHFFLSIAIQRGWEEALWVYEEQLDPDEYSDDLTSCYLEMTFFLNLSYMRVYTEEENADFQKHFGFLKNQYEFRIAWILFLNIGINGFGFSLEEIEEAYFTKNAINHQRQEEGY